MTSNEAHNEAMIAVINLAKWGVKTMIQPCCLSRNNETAKKFKGPERADFDQWCNVVFFPSSEKQIKMIDKVRESLFDKGMYFDHGFGLSEKNNQLEEDWQLDWSFRYSKQC